MIRHTLPPDHNHTDKRFPRTLREAFPNDKDQALFDPEDKAVLAFCLFAFAYLLALLMLGY